MATPVYRGTTEPVIHRQTIRSDPNRGTVIDTWYSCISATNLINLYNQFQFNGVAVEFTTEGGKVLLHANDATLNNPVDTWELVGDSERKDLFQNPNWGVFAYDTVGSQVSQNQMAQIRQYLENNIPAHGPANTSGAFDLPGVGLGLIDLSALSDTIVERAYSRYLAGNDEFENDAYAGGYVLKHTANIPNRWIGYAGQDLFNTNCGAIYSPANLLTEVSSSLWTLPVQVGSYFYNKLQILGADVPNVRNNYMWGWKKGRQTLDYAANNRLNAVQHYVLEQFSTDDYFVN